MTTIAWDEVTLATDSRATADTTIVNHAEQKLFSIQKDTKYKDDLLLAFAAAGDCHLMPAFEEWLASGCKLADKITENNDHIYEALVVGTKRVYHYRSDYNTMLPIYGKITIGSGGDFALAAMDFGRNAKQAVKYAMDRDSGTGGKIQSVKLR